VKGIGTSSDYFKPRLGNKSSNVSDICRNRCLLPYYNSADRKNFALPLAPAAFSLTLFDPAHETPRKGSPSVLDERTSGGKVSWKILVRGTRDRHVYSMRREAAAPVFQENLWPRPPQTRTLDFCGQVGDSRTTDLSLLN
jgi:hypothetical protein